MSRATLHRQVGRPGYVLAHYTIATKTRPGVVWSRTPSGLLFSFGVGRHGFALGWMR